MVSVPLAIVDAGAFDLERLLADMPAHAFAAVVMSGLVTREFSLGGQPTMTLLGPGDVVGSSPASPGPLAVAQMWTAVGSARVAILDDHFLKAVRAWPRIVAGLVERMAQCQGDTMIQLTVSQQPRVEDRLIALFRQLSTRWGRVTPDGIVIVLALTHEALGRIVGARRPTVTLALKALALGDRLSRRRDGSWLLGDEPVAATPVVIPLRNHGRPLLSDLSDPV